MNVDIGYWFEGAHAITTAFLGLLSEFLLQAPMFQIFTVALLLVICRAIRSLTA